LINRPISNRQESCTSHSDSDGSQASFGLLHNLRSVGAVAAARGPAVGEVLHDICLRQVTMGTGAPSDCKSVLIFSGSIGADVLSGSASVCTAGRRPAEPISLGAGPAERTEGVFLYRVGSWCIEESPRRRAWWLAEIAASRARNVTRCGLLFVAWLVILALISDRRADLKARPGRQDSVLCCLPG